MLDKKFTWVAAIIVPLVAGPAHAQEYIPMGEPDTAAEAESALSGLADLGSLTSRIATTASSPATPTVKILDPFTCAVIPPLTELETKVQSKSMSTSSAVKLGLPIGSFEASGSGKVLVQDWTRSKPCLSNDGKTQLLYGQAVRVVASISEIDANAAVSLATIAAQATLNSKASNIQANLVGITDVPSLTAAAALLGPLNVENFKDKSTVVQTIVTNSLAAPGGQSRFLGVVQDQPNLNLQVASAFALAQISERKSCMNARAQLEAASVEVLAAVESVYLSVAGVCDDSKPSAVAKATAEEALMGIKIKQ